MAIKNITWGRGTHSTTSSPLPDHARHLIIEGMAQTAGILVGEARQYHEKVVLAKDPAGHASRAWPGPASSLRYEATTRDHHRTGRPDQRIVYCDVRSWTAST